MNTHTAHSDDFYPNTPTDINLKYTAQTLTDAQKEQVRTNIGAGVGDMMCMNEVDAGDYMSGKQLVIDAPVVNTYYYTNLSINGLTITNVDITTCYKTIVRFVAGDDINNLTITDTNGNALIYDNKFSGIENKTEVLLTIWKDIIHIDFLTE